MEAQSRRDGLAVLYQRHYPELVRLGYALSSDWGLAEEFAQEAFVRAWRRWGEIRREQSAPAYLRATVVNLARTSLRRRLRENGVWPRHDDAGHSDPGARIDLLRALASLPSRKRACVVLRFYLDLSEADTAAALGVSVGTVKSQTAKALRRLQTQLDDGHALAAGRLQREQGGA